MNEVSQRFIETRLAEFTTAGQETLVRFTIREDWKHLESISFEFLENRQSEIRSITVDGKAVFAGVGTPSDVLAGFITTEPAKRFFPFEKVELRRDIQIVVSLRDTSTTFATYTRKIYFLFSK